ncbi:CAP domain-containing protein [Georgenia satyanarayanai]|uniref:CAP domain-containing protein n=1 Tax=Georgenia satyanarayanai TaxID=860221 RepID=UPI00203AFD08|nr:CAP domain-containing protein [Georgenia satyanarayanai]MCM3662193.1 CAP domain-containing protein [Georgenia satyanarayanai]
MIGHISSPARLARAATAFLAVLLVITCLSAVPASATETDAARFEDRILQLLNADRRDKGLRPVQRATELDSVARSWSGKMAGASRMSHNPSYSKQIPTGWTCAGENVAYGYQTPEAMYRGWYNSPGHYANMFDARFTHIGIGIAYRNDPDFGAMPYGTQNFAAYSGKTLTTTARPGSTPAGPPAGSVPGTIDDGGIGGSGNQFHLANSFSGSASSVYRYGTNTSRVYVGDWNGDGTDTLAYRVGSTFYIRDHAGAGPATRTISYGRPGDRVYVGDWDGDGVDTFAVRRGSTYHVKNSVTGGAADHVISYGRPGDDVLVGDWNGDGRDTFAVRRGGTYYVKNAIKGGNADAVITYGRPRDDVYVGDWDGDGVDTFAVRRGRTYYLANTIRGGAADRVLVYGRTEDTTLVGDWDGDRRDSLGIRR